MCHLELYIGNIVTVIFDSRSEQTLAREQLLLLDQHLCIVNWELLFTHHLTGYHGTIIRLASKMATWPYNRILICAVDGHVIRKSNRIRLSNFWRQNLQLEWTELMNLLPHRY